jgi:hypothetical protein
MGRYNLKSIDAFSINAGEGVDRKAAKQASSVLIESPDFNSRRITANIVIEGGVPDVWSILTDYDRLAEHIPNLVQSYRVTSPSGGIRLFQEGAQKIVGFDFRASLTMDMAERKESDEQAIKDRAINFKLVDSFMFSTFDGSWTVKTHSRRKVENPVSGLSEYLYFTQLTYSVLVRPRGPVPVMALEWRIREDIPINLVAVKIAAEKRANKRRLLPPSASYEAWESDETLGMYFPIEEEGSSEAVVTNGLMTSAANFASKQVQQGFQGFFNLGSRVLETNRGKSERVF